MTAVNRPLSMHTQRTKCAPYFNNEVRAPPCGQNKTLSHYKRFYIPSQKQDTQHSLAGALNVHSIYCEMSFKGDVQGISMIQMLSKD